MSSYLIIDGYNLINKWPHLVKAKEKSIELARCLLFDLIQQYCDSTEAKGIIIYDGGQKKRSVYKGNPTVIYSNKKETADTVIESIIYKAADKSRVRLVTDDRAMANLVYGMGAFVTSVKMFKAELESELSSMRGYYEK